MKLVKHEKYPDMYYIEWPDGTRSIDTPKPDRKDGHYGFYSLTNAKEIMKREGIENYTPGITYGSPLGRPETGSTAI